MDRLNPKVQKKKRHKKHQAVTNLPVSIRATVRSLVTATTRKWLDKWVHKFHSLPVCVCVCVCVGVSELERQGYLQQSAWLATSLQIYTDYSNHASKNILPVLFCFCCFVGVKTMEGGRGQGDEQPRRKRGEEDISLFVQHFTKCTHLHAIPRRI